MGAPGRNLTVALLVCGVFGLQDEYKVIQEDLTVDYQDGRFINLTAGVRKLNETAAALNVTFTLKTCLPQNVTLTLRAFKWLLGNYSLCLIHVGKTLKSITEMESFDLHALWFEYSRPPVAWPLERNVTYHIAGWIPDSSKYPPNAPAGKWKIEATAAFTNETVIFIANWFAKVVYGV